MATIGEMIVKLLADTGNFNASMDEAAAKVTASNDAMAASMASSMQSFRDFDNIQKGSIQTAEDLAQAQAALQAAQASGAFTTEELAAKEALVAQAMKNVGSETEAASGFLSMFTRNSRTMYSTSALITDAMTGQFSRMRREVAALGNETGLMARAFRLITSPAGVAALAVAGLGVAFVEAADRFGRFQQTILSTGDIIGMTAGQLQTMADDVGRVTGASFDSVEAINAIGRSGLFTGNNLRMAAEAAVYFSQVTGENMSKAASVIEQLQDKPKEAIKKLNDQYHFLTEGQAELIVKLLKTGDSAQAAAVAVKAFHDAMADRAQQMDDNTTALARDWHDVKQWTEGSAEALAEYLNLLGGSKDTTDQLNRAYIQLANDQSGLFRLAHPFTNQADAIKQDMQAIDALRDKQAQEATQAQKTAQANAAAAATLDKGLGKGGTVGPTVSDLESQFKEQEAKAHASYDQMKVDAADFWNAQATDAKNSAAVQAEAWQKYIDARHQLDEQGLRNESETDRKREESAMKAAEAAKRAAEGRARAEQQASQEIQQEIQKENALREQTAEGELQIAQKNIAIDRQALQDQYDAHQINAARLLQGELKLDDQLLAAQLAYLNKKKALDAGDAAAVAKDQQQITLVTLDAQQKRLQDLDRFHKEAEQKWKQYTQRVDGMVASQVNAMLFQHQTLKGAISNILESITSDWIRNEVEQLTQTQATGAAKVAANVMSDQSTVVSHAAAAAETKAISAATGKTEIGNAAASAAAKAFNAMAGIPIVGPVLGAIAAAATFVAVEAFGSNIASARGGWERVPADGMVTELHRDEMVLPKHVADPIRNMARGGGNGGGVTHVHLNGMDGKSLASFLKRNPRAFQMALAHAGRNGW